MELEKLLPMSPYQGPPFPPIPINSLLERMFNATHHYVDLDEARTMAGISYEFCKREDPDNALVYLEKHKEILGREVGDTVTSEDYKECLQYIEKIESLITQRKMDRAAQMFFEYVGYLYGICQRGMVEHFLTM